MIRKYGVYDQVLSLFTLSRKLPTPARAMPAISVVYVDFVSIVIHHCLTPGLAILRRKARLIYTKNGNAGSGRHSCCPNTDRELEDIQRSLARSKTRHSTYASLKSFSQTRPPLARRKKKEPPNPTAAVTQTI